MSLRSRRLRSLFDSKMLDVMVNEFVKAGKFAEVAKLMLKQNSCWIEKDAAMLIEKKKKKVAEAKLKAMSDKEDVMTCPVMLKMEDAMEPFS